MLYSIIPYSILITSSILLLNHVYRSSKRVAHVNMPMPKPSSTTNASHIKKVSWKTKSENKFNKAIVVSTIIYILMTLPSAIATFYIHQWWGTDMGNLLINICDDLTLSYHGYVFFVIYVINNRRFRRQLKQIYTTTKAKVNEKIRDSSVNTFIISYLLKAKKTEKKDENIIGSV